MDFIIISISPLSDGGMAELVDALDSKSCGLRPCQFESDYPYQSTKPCKSTVCEAFLYVIVNKKKHLERGVFLIFI